MSSFDASKGLPMASFEESIEVNVNVSEAYLLFSDFERFPLFMQGVDRVVRTGDDTLMWHATVRGRTEEWLARITELAPSKRISWESVSGARNTGSVSFERVADTVTRVHLRIEYEPDGLIENVGTVMGIVNSRMREDLQRFKRLAEAGAAVHGANASGPPLHRSIL
ncbi:MAG TPA: SRPBCC family protein [Trueperaceae bacterium]|nr:SRPBCC family protein [Trueperaceae bacterium]